MSWLEIKAHVPDSPDLSPFIEIYRDFGVENTMETGSTLTGAIANVEGATTHAQNLSSALKAAGATSVETRELPEENWDQLWRQFFKPRRVGERFVVRPTWEQYEAQPEDMEIVLDPGQAFGTGDHPTTRLCLELLEQTPVQGGTVCDLGCGSGILSIAACKLGARSLVAIDIEPLAVEVALQNAAMNGVEFTAEVGDGMPENQIFDLVISNIISAILIRISSDVRLAVKPGGRWIVSGIISQNWQDVLSAASDAGFVLKEHREEDGWVAATFDRP